MESCADPTAPAVVKITDAHLNDLYTNRVLAELSGYQPDELERTGWMNIVDPQAQSLFEEVAQSIGEQPYVRECFETNIVCRDGSSRTLAWEVVSLSPDQFPLMLITAREAAQKRLPGSGFARTRHVSPIPSGLWEEIFDALPDCVSIHDGNFTVVAANRSLCERLSLSRDEIVGRKCHEVFHALGQPIDQCVLVRAMAGPSGKRVRREAFERQFKGVCQIEAVAFPESRSGMRGAIHTLRTSESFESGMGAASRRELDSLSRLAGAVAHDYNNLLSGIIGYTGMLQMLPDLPAKAQRYIEELHKSAGRLNDMTQRLLLFGRQRPPRTQNVDLGRLITEALDSPSGVPADRKVETEIPDSPVAAKADPLQIQVVVNDLVRNALEATEQSGGQVVVRVLRRSPSKPFATFFTVAPPGDYACIEVRDTGHGIDSDSLVHVFEPFSKPDGRSTGRGLGLAVVYRIVHNHSGYIEAESERGVGTRVTVLLPAADETS